jgi:hypothetical protein
VFAREGGGRERDELERVGRGGRQFADEPRELGRGGALRAERRQRQEALRLGIPLDVREERPCGVGLSEIEVEAREELPVLARRLELDRALEGGAGGPVTAPGRPRPPRARPRADRRRRAPSRG